MKILLTGGTGFLGSYLLRAFLNEGHEIILLKRTFSNTSRISDILPMIQTYDTDRCSIDQPFIDNGKIDAIIHVATNYGRDNEPFIEILKSNVFFPFRLLEVASSYNTNIFINTDTKANKNLNFYALTKFHFREISKYLVSLKKIRFVNVKLEHMYGPCDIETKFPTYIIKSCLQNEPELRLTKGEQKRDFIYIDDVVAAYLLILRHEVQSSQFYKEYEIGSGVAISIRHFVELVHRFTQSRTTLNFGFVPYRQNEIMESKANIEELKKIGWLKKIDLEDGIKKTILSEKGNKWKRHS